MAKIRRTIRIGGKQKSRYFKSHRAADQWYIDQKHKKIFKEAGTPILSDSRITLISFFDMDWFPRRQKSNPKSTWGCDAQRFRDYVVPILGTMEIGKITAAHVRSMLLRVTEQHGLSHKTRDQVRALVSTIFNDAINRDIPLTTTNPTFGLKFSGKRTGKRQPQFLKDRDDCLKFMKAARELGHPYLTWAALMLMSGMRSQEVIALRWGSVDFDRGTIEVKEKYIQAERRVVPGTKRGSLSTRVIPVSDALIKVLKAQSSKLVDSSTKNGSYSYRFILETAAGSHLHESAVKKICDRINECCSLKATPHGLRHTFGREFAMRSQNMKALQDILGHSSITTTQIYSELGGHRLTPFKDVVSFEDDDQ